MYATLLQLAFANPANAIRFVTPPVQQAEARFEAAQNPQEQVFRFEQWRLGVGLSLLQLVTDLGDQPESRQLVPVLHRALTQSRSPEDIDRIMEREGRLFDELYNNLYVNEEGEELFNLFARTLEADRPELLADVIAEAVALVPHLDFERDDEDDE
jgi:hypothetical protein